MLVSLFRDNLKAEGINPKYLNRDFLAVYIHAYNERKKNIDKGIYHEYGTPEYEFTPVFETKFYKANKTAYYRFIDFWHGHKTAMEYMKNGCNGGRAEYERIKVGIAGYLLNERECRHIAGY